MSSDLSPEQYADLAEFRRQIRKFLYFSETTAKEYGIEPQQHQALLTIQGLPEAVKPTIRELATRLFIQHHSAVELINRLVQAGFVTRNAGTEDKREVLVRITAEGRSQLRKLALAHRAELDESGPELAKALSSVLRHNKSRAV